MTPPGVTALARSNSACEAGASNGEVMASILPAGPAGGPSGQDL